MKYFSVTTKDKDGEFSVDLHAIQAIIMEKKEGSFSISVYLEGRESPLKFNFSTGGEEVYTPLMKVWRERDLHATT